MGGGLGSKINRVSDIVTIDANIGLVVLGANSGRVEVEDVTIYGAKDMLNEDCVGGASCSSCMSKAGIYMPTFGGQLTSIPLAPKELHKMFSSNGSWDSSSLFKRV